MTHSGIEKSQITYTNTITVEEYNALFRAVGWGDFQPEQLTNAIKNSTFIIVAKDGERIIGAARIVWDGGDGALLRDVVVLPEYQGHGIGRELVKRTIDFIQQALRPGWVVRYDLIASTGKDGFYSKLGFETCSVKDGGTAHMRMNLHWKSD
ncbi:MAG: GNAT family N-acetyltransferase [Ruminococcus sp.]|jgi:GNAT superfamily N-acetyltransferase|nr:GNAT family N-acetyltransferase [Ruminococcus sp.]